MPLSNGAGYFANEDAFKEYIKSLGQLGPEVSIVLRFGKNPADDSNVALNMPSVRRDGTRLPVGKDIWSGRAVLRTTWLRIARRIR